LGFLRSPDSLDPEDTGSDNDFANNAGHLPALSVRRMTH